MSDAELVRLARTGRAEAYAELAQRWAARAFAVRMSPTISLRKRCYAAFGPYTRLAIRNASGPGCRASHFAPAWTG